MGSNSSEWLGKTFTEKQATEIEKTAYLTANPHSREAIAVTPDRFEVFDEIWRYGFDDSLGTIPPRVVTDRAIRVGRRSGADRIIVHYMQPHHPIIAENAPLRGESSIRGHVTGDPSTGQWKPGDTGRHNIWDSYRRGEVDRDDLVKSYRANLLVVLDEVELLLDNIDADRAILTADHGNAMGELKIYGHPAGFLHPSVKRVPWIRTSGTDSRCYEPEVVTDEDGDGDVEAVLKSLGYVE